MGGWNVVKKMNNFANYIHFDASKYVLLQRLMTQIEIEAALNGVAVLYLLFPNGSQYLPNLIKRNLLDVYAETYLYLSNYGHSIIDVRELFRKSNYEYSELFSADNYHFKAKANRTIADGIKPIVVNLLEK